MRRPLIATNFEIIGPRAHGVWQAWVSPGHQSPIEWCRLIE